MIDATGESPWDALVIGAGPAGSIAARQLAIGGARVLLVDRAAFPRRKVCGACLNAQALAELDAVGLGGLVGRLGAVALTEFRMSVAGRSTTLPLPAGAAITRPRLDSALVEAAEAAGVRVLQETGAIVGPVEAGVRRVGLAHRGREVLATARVVLVAAGLGHRCLDREPAVRTRVASGSRVGAGCIVEEAPDYYRESTIFMGVGRGGYVGLVRVEDGRLNVAAAFDVEFLRRHGRPGLAASALLAEGGLPWIEALAGADWQGTVGLTRSARPLAAERLFLLGDAAGYVEPFTGEGMGWALASARAVAPIALRAIDRWDGSLPRAWSRRQRALVGRRQALCRGLVPLSRHPRPAVAALELVSHAPALVRLLTGRAPGPPLLSRAN